MRKRYSRSYTVLSFLTMFSYRELPFPCPLFFEELEVCVAHGTRMQLHIADVADAR